MSIAGMRRRRGVDRGFVLSDHADFGELTAAVRSTGAERVLLTHGYSEQFARWLRECGIDAGVLSTEFGEGGDGGDDGAAVV